MLKLDSGEEDDCEDVACVGGTYEWGQHVNFTICHHPLFTF